MNSQVSTTNNVTTTSQMNVPPVLEWVSTEDIGRDPAVANRNLFARKFAQEDSLDKILLLWTGMTAAQAKYEFLALFDELGVDTLAGSGIEIGAGLAPLAACAANRFDKIKTILAVELVPDVVTLLQRRVLETIAGERQDRIQGVIGSFDDMDVPSGSMNFCLEFDALHHSNDLKRTLTEVARVLRPDGVLICLDRGHPSWLTEEQRQVMLNVEYPLEWKQKQGYSEETLTRSQNGEHEIRLDEWRDAFDQTGFDVEQYLEFRPVSAKLFLRKCLLAIPFGIRRRVNLWPSRVSPEKGELAWMLTVLLRGKARHPVFRQSGIEHTVFMARRRG